jgi:hypothetical protein
VLGSSKLEVIRTQQKQMRTVRSGRYDSQCRLLSDGVLRFDTQSDIRPFINAIKPKFGLSILQVTYAIRSPCLRYCSFIYYCWGESCEISPIFFCIFA